MLINYQKILFKTIMRYYFTCTMVAGTKMSDNTCWCDVQNSEPQTLVLGI